MKVTEGFNDRMSTDESEVSYWLKNATKEKEDDEPAEKADDDPPEQSPK